jgi:protein SCO1
MKTGWLLAALALSSTLACGRDDSTTTRPARDKLETAIPASDAPAKPLATVKDVPAEPSIYDLALRLTDETGTVRSLDSFRGQPVLVTMFYAGCPSACPLLTSDLKRIEKLIPEPMRSKVRVLMVSFDAERDTPSVLARLKRERGMDATRWTLASSVDDEARELAGVLGIRYRKLDNGEFFHASVIVLLDAQGRPQVRLDGIGSDPAAILSALAASST